MEQWELFYMEKEWLKWHGCSTVGTAQGCMGRHGVRTKPPKTWEVLKTFRLCSAVGGCKGAWCEGSAMVCSHCCSGYSRISQLFDLWHLLLSKINA